MVIVLVRVIHVYQQHLHFTCLLVVMFTAMIVYIAEIIENVLNATKKKFIIIKYYKYLNFE